MDTIWVKHMDASYWRHSYYDWKIILILLELYKKITELLINYRPIASTWFDSQAIENFSKKHHEKMAAA